MELGLTELVLGVTAASFLPPVLLATAQKVWCTKFVRKDWAYSTISVLACPAQTHEGASAPIRRPAVALPQARQHAPHAGPVFRG